MQLSREFAGFMGLVLLFLLASFATEDTRCIARARRAFQQLYRPTPAAIAGAEVRPAGEAFTFAALGAPVAPEGCLRPAESGR